METVIKTCFVELVSILGFVPTLILLIALTVLLWVGKNTIKSFAQSFWNFITGKKKKKRLDKHLFFQKIDYLINYTLYTVKTPCPIRKQIYIDAMKIRLEVYKQKINEFVKQNLNDYSKSEFQIKVFSMLDEAKKVFVMKAKEDGIPQFILDRLNEKVFSFYEVFYSEIKIFCESDYIYHDNNDRMYSILDLVMVKCEFYMNKFEKELASFNGELKNHTYKGISCVNCTSCVHDKYLEELKEEIKQDESTSKED